MSMQITPCDNNALLNRYNERIIYTSLIHTNYNNNHIMDRVGMGMGTINDDNDNFSDDDNHFTPVSAPTWSLMVTTSWSLRIRRRNVMTCDKLLFLSGKKCDEKFQAKYHNTTTAYSIITSKIHLNPIRASLFIHSLAIKSRKFPFQNFIISRGISGMWAQQCTCDK